MVDPLTLMSLQVRPTKELGVLIQPFDRQQDYREFRGFTYHLPCQ